MHWVLAWKFRDPSNASTVRVALQQLHGIPVVLHVSQALALCYKCSRLLRQFQLLIQFFHVIFASTLHKFLARVTHFVRHDDCCMCRVITLRGECKKQLALELGHTSIAVRGHVLFPNSSFINGSGSRSSSVRRTCAPIVGIPYRVFPIRDLFRNFRLQNAMQCKLRRPSLVPPARCDATFGLPEWYGFALQTPQKLRRKICRRLSLHEWDGPGADLQAPAWSNTVASIVQ
jgi:hypothetical protein